MFRQGWMQGNRLALKTVPKQFVYQKDPAMQISRRWNRTPAVMVARSTRMKSNFTAKTAASGEPSKSKPLLFAIGTIGGLGGSAVGLGGGFLAIPLMTTFARFSQHSAHATSLVGVVATSIGGIVSYGMNGEVDFYAVAPLTLGALLTVGLGVKISNKLNGAMLRRGLGVVMVMIAPMVAYKEELFELIKDKKGEQDTNTNDPYRKYGLLTGLGCVTGLCAGVFGVGGGAVVAPGLMLFTDLGYHSIVGTTLGAMTLPSMAGAFQHYRNGFISPRLAAALALGTLVGSIVGGTITCAIKDEKKLRQMFSLVVVASGLKLIL
uniref:Membrane transporter protein n=1 Tax=Mucochytrium quahogii TaxID=96639 RepID=A0A7S2SIV8_9STRA|mmetsp:Transcript_2839/g.4095  ORF Transcript_2839/g.4095 Transcript_2839/m.4095 type:complete len:321 (+) Transcript_2839:145-1107(+)|eukprot:CAMPEP_0203744072 /NCGR_PEP_ID=MMETSP0098-20131031/273_1 /ASSEMBLY_ACC=CAM_ASM_000208 /TAXON_ID=96639 /ORGANISM=" , Strain NY0313808BC1" /LENGTH=320 /DNA_ID=CAMNT_0050631497 /DNA_START=305 /DNA_END=1267 /DNA_ORIENTATION=+